MNNRFFARAKTPHLPPGAWTEVTQGAYANFMKTAGAKSFNFEKRGIQGYMIGEAFPISTFQYIEPELYKLLKGDDDEGDGDGESLVGA